MRSLNEERGAIAVLVAFCLVALLGFGALVLDAGALYRERRELQNGADAAALAVAKDCADAGCGAYTTTAETYADANADDAASDVAEVCGSVSYGLTACTDPPDLPSAVSYVRVRATTRNAATGGDEIRFGLARVLGFEGRTVQARSAVAWGPPSPGTSLSSPPLIFSLCEFYSAVGDADADGEPDTEDLPSYPTDDPTADPAALRTIYFHDPSSEEGCPAGPSGFDESGGFGWLESTSCVAETYTVTNSAGEDETWVRTKTGTPVPNGCDPANWHDGTSPTVLTFPFFDTTNGQSGDNLAYRIAGYASMYVTGFRFPAGRWPNTFQCPGGANESCLQGYFVRTVVSGSEFGTVDLGTVMVKVIE